MIYFQLFITFFKIGLFSFGGGYGMLPLMEQEVIAHDWLTEAQFFNFVAISESTPGPIAINMATFVGTGKAGVLGALCSTLGAIMPSIIIILLILLVFKKFLEYKSVRCVMDGIRPVIVGLIASTGILLALKNFMPNVESFSFAGVNYKALGLMLALGAVAVIYKKIRKKNISAILLIVSSAVAGALIF